MGGSARLNLLLDTHVWIWALVEPRRLGTRAARVLKGDGEKWLSPVSIWEALVLAEKGRLRVRRPARSWLREQLDAVPLQEAALTSDVALEAGSFHLPHGDPADRLLVATARIYELTLVTADERLLHARACRVLAAR